MTNNCSKENVQNNQCMVEAQGTRVCAEGVSYVQKELSLPPKRAVLACEGGCIKGEVARVAANILAYKLQREAAVRICLGDAATGNSGFIDLINRAPEVIAVEGCPLKCGTEIMRRRIPDLKTTAIDASALYQFDRSKYFEIFDMPRTEIEEHANKVAEYIQARYFNTRCDRACCSSVGCCE
ncbi:MAG TPA: putative zinc-binding protein [Anaerovoracaceae bacterium]|nr:putative zinc-binding protein [Anaerovoracaceae bacterium]